MKNPWEIAKFCFSERSLLVNSWYLWCTFVLQHVELTRVKLPSCAGCYVALYVTLWSFIIQAVSTFCDIFGVRCIGRRVDVLFYDVCIVKVASTWHVAYFENLWLDGALYVVILLLTAHSTCLHHVMCLFRYYYDVTLVLVRRHCYEDVMSLIHCRICPSRSTSVVQLNQLSLSPAIISIILFLFHDLNLNKLAGCQKNKTLSL